MSKFEEFFPNDYIHLLLAAFCADETGKKGGKCPLQKNQAVKFKQETGIYKFMKTEKNVDLNKYLQQWIISEIFDDDQTGYLGLLLENQKNKQLVLSHRSTNFQLSLNSNIFKESGLQCDIMSVVLGTFTNHQQQAYQSTQKAVEKAKQLNYSLSFCGHSLGAWLAELSVYYCHSKFNEPFPNTKAVTFDGPGSFEMMQLMDQNNVKGQSQQFYPEQLDIVYYLSIPNMVNCMNSHIGIGYRLYKENYYKLQLPILKSFQSYLDAFLSIQGHQLEMIIPLFDPQTGKPKQETYFKIIKWPSIKYQQSNQGNMRNLSEMLRIFSNICCPEILLKLIFRIGVKLSCYITCCSTIIGFVELLQGNIDLNQYFQVHEILLKTKKYDPQVKNEEEFDLEIKGGYQIITPNDYEKAIKNSKQIDSIDEHLINLKKNSNQIVASSCSRELKQILISISNVYQYRKQVFNQCIEIKPEFRDKITINLLRDQIRMITRDRIQDFEVFLNEDPNYTNKILPCFFNRIFVYQERWIQREELKEIENLFSQQNVVVITGPSKFGKTALAYQYAKKIKDQCKAIVFPFNAENKSTLLPNETYSYEQLLNDIFADMQNINQEIIIILDNLQNLELSQAFIAQWKQYFQIIITTVNNQIFSQTQYQIVKISAMTEQECLKYIDKAIPQKKLDDQQKKMLINLSNCIPFRLDLYIDLLIDPKNCLQTNDERLKYIKQNNDYEYSKKIMNYISWLNPSNIEQRLIQQLLSNHESPKENEINQSLIKLAEQGFISILENRCIMIDKVVQSEFRRQQQTSQLIQEILLFFYKELPNIEYEKHNSQDIQKARIYHLHAKYMITLIAKKQSFSQFLQNNNLDLFNYATIITLKLSIIYQFIIRDYQSCQYYLDLFCDQYFQAMKMKQPFNLEALTIAIINKTKLFLTINKKKEALENAQLFQIIENEFINILPSIKAQIYYSIAIVYQQYQLYDYSNNQLEISSKLCCSKQGEEDLMSQKILMAQAENYQFQKQYNEAVKLYKQLSQNLKILKDKNNLIDVDILQAKLYFQLGRISSKKKQNPERTIDYFNLAITILAEKSKNKESLEMAELYFNLGLVQKKMKIYKESLRALQDAYQLKRKIIGDIQHDTFAEISYQIGLLMIETNQIDEAILEFQKAKTLMDSSDNYKLKFKIDFQVALIQKLNGQKFYYIKFLEELINKKRLHYAYINTSIKKDIQQLADAYAELFKDDAKQTILYQLLYFITILHETKFQYYQQKNPIADQQEQAKFQVNYKNSNVKWLKDQHSQEIIKRFDKNFFNTEQTRTLIIRGGIINEEEFQIKEQLQASTLNQIRQYTLEGKWNTSIITGFALNSVSDFISRKHLKNQLKEKLHQNQNFKIVLMFCFEAINIGIVQSNFVNIGFANKFITKINKYENMQNFLEDVIQQHPEYFIDGKILKSLTNDQNVLIANLGEEEKLITSDKEVSRIILTMC
ncbi:unnamed protein product [Paramecium octaurelia]|uniref:Tetratricopeptide repeat protein n=1 Tax=Paramecium octaurelia TaxID=43137 RepID=A0A8S1UA23_PAROT|nr:unnamed protein product [Paramecium octaurelia]